MATDWVPRHFMRVSRSLAVCLVLATLGFTGYSFIQAEEDPLAELFTGIERRPDDLPRRIMRGPGTVVIGSQASLDRSIYSASGLRYGIATGGIGLRAVRTFHFVDRDGDGVYQRGTDEGLSQRDLFGPDDDATRAPTDLVSADGFTGPAGDGPRYLHIGTLLTNGQHWLRTIGPPVQLDDATVADTSWHTLLIQWHTRTRIEWRRVGTQLQLQIGPTERWPTDGSAVAAASRQPVDTLLECDWDQAVVPVDGATLTIGLAHWDFEPRSDGRWRVHIGVDDLPRHGTTWAEVRTRVRMIPTLADDGVRLRIHLEIHPAPRAIGRARARNRGR